MQLPINLNWTRNLNTKIGGHLLLTITHKYT